MELSEKVRQKLPTIMQNRVWKAITDNKIKDNPDYSVYNFRSKKQEDKFIESGVCPSGVPNIYNENAVDFLVNILIE